MRYSFIIVVCIVVTCAVAVDTSKLTAVSLNIYGNIFYKAIQTEDSASSEDPAAKEVRQRERICEEIASGSFISWMNYKLIDKRNLYRKRKDSRYARIFDQLYTPTKEYINPYRRKETDFYKVDEAGERHYYTEYVFVCPFKHRLTREVVPFYVTKEYNISPFGDPSYMPGRFVLRSLREPPHLADENYVLLAEEPAIVYPTKTIELTYLQIRKYIAPANSLKDPLCRIVSRDLFHTHNQHNRICVVVTTSDSLKSKFEYPSPTFTSGCQEMEIAFRTTKGIKEAAGLTYHERMTMCGSIPRDKKGALYISRGYKSQQVFVYRQDRSDMKIYLHSLHTNVKIVDELNSFDFVEY